MENKTTAAYGVNNAVSATIKNYSQAYLGQNPSVNLATGGLRYVFDDLAIGAGDFAININHVYLSRIYYKFIGNYDMFGKGWKLNLSQRLILDNDDFLYLDEQGEVHRFVKFDGNRYYDDRNAKTTLTENDDGFIISDGIGNKLCFTEQGLLCKSISCHNSSMVKTFNYDSKNRLISVYDNRTIPSGGSVAKSRIELEYDDSLLISMTSYGNFNRKLSKLTYNYDSRGYLISVEKTAFNSNSKEALSKQIFEFTYDSNGFLSLVTDCATNSAQKFTFYNNGRVSEHFLGELTDNNTSQNNVSADNVISSGMTELGITECKASPNKKFVSIKSNKYFYSTESSDEISCETMILNDKGLFLVYYIDQNAQITSTFELIDDNNIKTLQRQGAKRTGLTGTSEYINGNGSATTINGIIYVPLPDDFDVARNKNENEIETFEYSVWVKHNSYFNRLQMEVSYTIDKITYKPVVQLQPDARRVWQRVSVPIYIPKNKTNKLENLSIRFLSANGQVSDRFYVNEIGFSPAPHSCTRIPTDSGDYMEYKDIKYVIANNDNLTANNDIDTFGYMTEEDIMATYANKYANGYANGDKDCFDVIYENNTKRKANVYSLKFRDVAGKTASATDTYQTYTQLNSLDNVIQADYVHSTSYLTIHQKCTFKDSNNKTKTSETKTKVDYKGKTLRETDEYGVMKVYEYDGYGRLLVAAVGYLNGDTGSAVFYDYDSEGRLISSHNGLTGQQLSYNAYDQVKSATEGNIKNYKLQPTQHHADSTYDVFADKVLRVTEYDGATAYANKTITYENGRVRAVTDGMAKYGVKYDIAKQKVEYTEFVDGEEKTIQTDTINGELHSSKFVDGREIITHVDEYGRITKVEPSHDDDTWYHYDTIAESNFANKPTKRSCGNNETEYVYDYDGELAGFTEKRDGERIIEVRQVAPDVTKYTYADNREYFAVAERDSDKMLNPRITAVNYFMDSNSGYDSPNPTARFKTDYEYDNFGQVAKKTCYSRMGPKSITDYKYETVSENTRLKQINLLGLSDFSRCEYTEDESYGANGEVTKIADIIKFKQPATDTDITIQNTREYGYNNLHQLTLEKQGGKTISYTYLPNGRLNTVNGVQRNYDAQGRLQSFADRTFKYNGYGNRSQEVNGGVERKFLYAYNMLTEAYIVKNGYKTNRSQYKYNPDGVRCEKTYNGVTTKYMLDGNKLLGEVQSGNLTGNNIYNGKRHIKYIYDTEGIQIVEIGDNAYRLVKDIFNNVVMVMNHDNSSLECIYRYDAFGNCTVYDKNGNKDTDINSVGNTNPIRWKSFYYDTETGFYYANGSYYDPSTGTYLDASPVSTIFDNVAALTNLDRNAPVCNNILELAGNPYTVFTTSNLSPDPTYDPNANAPWYVIVRNWIRNIVYQIHKWFNGISREDKFKAGVILLGLSLVISVGTGNPALIFAELAIGIGIGVASYLISPLFTGQSLTWDGLADAVVDSFLITSAFIFISTSVNAIKVLARSKPVTTAELKSYELDPRSIADARQGDPSWETFRSRVWKNEATFRPELYDDQVARMSKGLAPQVNGKSMHLHHVVGKANDMYNVIKVTQAQHIAIHQAIGYHYNAMWTLESIAHLL